MKNDFVPGGRLHSLDALRGFDMFFIMGGGGLLLALNKLFPCGVTEWLAGQMHHVEWNGFSSYDMIFPLFLFIAGVSFPYSYAKNIEKGRTRKSVYLNILRRALILVSLGIVYNGFFKFDFENLRFVSVLGRIGIAWAIAAVIYMNTNLKARIGIGAAILLGYCALLALVPAPDMAGAGSLTMEGNIVGYVDRMILPGKLYRDIFDPEGLLSTIPAVVTAMLGMTAGDMVKRVKDVKTGNKTVLMLAVTGALLIIIGQVWNLVFPINKNLWTSSFVCFVGGLSFLLFALFYYIIDIKGWKRWSFFFTVIGLNSITIYVAQRIINFRYTADFFGNGLVKLVPENAASLVSSAFYISVCWLFLYFLYRKKIFLKV